MTRLTDNLQRLWRAGQQALGRARGEPNAKTVRRAGEEARDAARGGTKAQRGRGKKKLGGVWGRILAGLNDFAVEDKSYDESKRKRREYIGKEPDVGFTEQDATADRSAVAHISNEYRAQVAAGMVAGRSFTQGSCLVPDDAGDDDDEEEDAKPKKTAKKKKKKNA